MSYTTTTRQRKELILVPAAPLDARIVEAYQILYRALIDHAPSRIFALFSGGYDSLVNTHLTLTWAQARGIPAAVRHINTRTGQLFMADPEPPADKPFLPLCVGCEGRYAETTTAQTFVALANEGTFTPRHDIFKLSNRTAKSITQQALADDPDVRGDRYTTTILHAAERLKGTEYEHFVYQTQYVSGTTVWRSMCDRHSVSVRADGQISASHSPPVAGDSWV